MRTSYSFMFMSLFPKIASLQILYRRLPGSISIRTQLSNPMNLYTKIL